MKNICKIEGCEKLAHGKGYCLMHYDRLKNNGDPMICKSVHGEDRKSNRLYNIYCDIKARCYNIRKKDYKYYGGRGITVDDRRLGLEGFSNFTEDMGEKGEGTSIDRIDNNGNYEPNNCRRATIHEQASNRRNNCDSVGVCFINSRKKRKASLNISGKCVLSKNFSTKEEAIDARKYAEFLYGLVTCKK